MKSSKRIIKQDSNDLYGYTSKYAGMNDNILSLDTSESNKELLRKYDLHMSARGLSVARKVKYWYILMKICKKFKKGLSYFSSSDVQEFLIWVHSSSLSNATKDDYILSLKKLFEFLGKDVDDFKLRRSRKRKLPEDMLTEEEIQLIINTVSNIRDKALFSLLSETGARIGEILNMRVSDVIFDDKGAFVMLNGKTGQRRNRIVKSISLLKEWFDSVPFENYKRFLWIAKHGRRLGYASVRKLLKKMEKKLNFSKRLYPHLFRHSRSTELAKHLTEQQLKIYLGWTADSRMASTYVHLSGKDVDDAILRINSSQKDIPENACFNEFMSFYKMWKERNIC